MTRDDMPMSCAIGSLGRAATSLRSGPAAGATCASGSTAVPRDAPGAPEPGAAKNGAGCAPCCSTTALMMMIRLVTIAIRMATESTGRRASRVHSSAPSAPAIAATRPARPRESLRRLRTFPHRHCGVLTLDRDVFNALFFISRLPQLAHQGKHLTAALPARRIRHAAERPALHFDPDKRRGLPAFVRAVAACAKLRGAVFRKRRGVAQRHQISGTIGDMDALQKPATVQRSSWSAEQGFGRRRSEQHVAVAAMSRDYVIGRMRQKAIAVRVRLAP